MRSHVTRALDLLERIEFGLPVTFALGQMHERLDGGGYPLGLAGEEIGLAGRILGAVDVFCARTAPRACGERAISTQCDPKTPPSTASSSRTSTHSRAMRPKSRAWAPSTGASRRCRLEMWKRSAPPVCGIKGVLGGEGGRGRGTTDFTIPIVVTDRRVGSLVIPAALLPR